MKFILLRLVMIIKSHIITRGLTLKKSKLELEDKKELLVSKGKGKKGAS